jgi:site-specific DNA-methyltransferase (adenine-specific)
LAPSSEAGHDVAVKRALLEASAGDRRRSVRLLLPGADEGPAPRAGRFEPMREGSSALRLIHGENAMALSALGLELERRVALAYLDPPFFTGRVHLKITRQRDRAGVLRREWAPAFDDRWDDLAEYLTSLRLRLSLVRELLTLDGSIVVHVDPRTSHYVKVLCDEIFGEHAFASEIIWRYRRWPSKTPNFQRVHDVLLRYVRDPAQKPRFVQLFEPLAASTRLTWGTGKQRAIVGKDGRRTRSSTMAEASPGTPLGDVWDIGIIAPVARERTGYPTQKPEALLERLLSACTRPDDLVLDPYAGSGTTLTVAARLGRRAVGIDASPVALRVSEKRLRALGYEPTTERCSRVSESPSSSPTSSAVARACDA